MQTFQDYLIVNGVPVPFEPSTVEQSTIIEGSADQVFYALDTNTSGWGVEWKVYGVPIGPDAGFIERDYTVNNQTVRLKVWAIALSPGKHWVSINGSETQWARQVKFEYVQKAGPELAYIPATSEGAIPGDNPAAFAPILKADGINYARIWTGILAEYGDIDAWAAAGLKPIVTTTFKEAKNGVRRSLAENATAAQYANNLATTAQRLRNAAIVQFWNEPQFGWYYPSDVTRDVVGLKRIFAEYYKPLSQSIGRGRMAGPSILPHYQGKEWLQMLVDAGFFDPAYTTWADFHLYFGRWASKQQVIDAVGECKAILPAGIKILSSEFGKDVNDTLKVKGANGKDTTELDYTTGNLQEIYATYATLGISPMAHFMGGSMSKFAAHTKGIYSRTGQRINDDVRACVRKVGAKVQQVAEQS